MRTQEIVRELWSIATRNGMVIWNGDDSPRDIEVLEMVSLKAEEKGWHLMRMGTNGIEKITSFHAGKYVLIADEGYLVFRIH